MTLQLAVFCYFLSHYFVLVSALGIPVHWLACKKNFTCYLGKATCVLLVIYGLIHGAPTLRGPKKWTEAVSAADCSTKIWADSRVQPHIMVPMEEKVCKTEPWKIQIYGTLLKLSAPWNILTWLQQVTRTDVLQVLCLEVAGLVQSRGHRKYNCKLLVQV